MIWDFSFLKNVFKITKKEHRCKFCRIVLKMVLLHNTKERHVLGILLTRKQSLQKMLIEELLEVNYQPNHKYITWSHIKYITYQIYHTWMNLLNYVPYVLKKCSLANVPCGLKCSRGNALCLHTYLSANVPGVLMCKRANTLCVLMCSCVKVPWVLTCLMYQNPLHAYVLSC